MRDIPAGKTAFMCALDLEAWFQDQDCAEASVQLFGTEAECRRAGCGDACAVAEVSVGLLLRRARSPA